MRDTWQIRVKGRVQGVGYRDSLRREAAKHAVTGWVRNRSDGTVEALLQGPTEAVTAVIAWARRGPPGAVVTEVHAEAAAADSDRSYDRFELRPSL